MVSELEKFDGLLEFMNKVKDLLYEEYSSLDIQIYANKFPKKWGIQILKISFTDEMENNFKPIFSKDKKAVICRRIIKIDSLKNIVKELNGRLMFQFEDIKLQLFTKMVNPTNFAYFKNKLYYYNTISILLEMEGINLVYTDSLYQNATLFKNADEKLFNYGENQLKNGSEMIKEKIGIKSISNQSVLYIIFPITSFKFDYWIEEASMNKNLRIKWDMKKEYCDNVFCFYKIDGKKFEITSKEEIIEIKNNFVGNLEFILTWMGNDEIIPSNEILFRKIIEIREEIQKSLKVDLIQRLNCKDPELINFLNERGNFLKYKNVEYYNHGQTACIYQIFDDTNNVLILKIHQPDQSLKREDWILKKIKHPNIIKLETNGTFESKFEGVHLDYTILEFFDGIPLNEGREHFSHRDFLYRLECAIQLISAIEELNKYYKNHGDLHEGNILLSEKPENEAYIKVIDPGMSSLVQNTGNDIDDFKEFCFKYFFTDKTELKNYNLNKIDEFRYLHEISKFLNELKIKNQKIDVKELRSDILSPKEKIANDFYQFLDYTFSRFKEIEKPPNDNNFKNNANYIYFKFEIWDGEHIRFLNQNEAKHLIIEASDKLKNFYSKVCEKSYDEIKDKIHGYFLKFADYRIKIEVNKVSIHRSKQYLFKDSSSLKDVLDFILSEIINISLLEGIKIQYSNLDQKLLS